MVITNTPGYEAPGAKIFTSLEQAIDAATTEKVFLIGGYNIWYHGLAMGLVDELLITSVDRYYPTDNETRFAPELLRPFDTWPEFYATDSKNFDHDDPPFRITTWKKAPK
jgi:dihydrofolate reductase